MACWLTTATAQQPKGKFAASTPIPLNTVPAEVKELIQTRYPGAKLILSAMPPPPSALKRLKLRLKAWFSSPCGEG